MPLYAIGNKEPTIHPNAFVHPDAVLIGDVRVGEFASIWPSAVLRGDSSFISVGARTSIQDGAIIHCTSELPTTIGDDCTVGHNAHLEGCTIENEALVGSGSLVLHEVVVESHALVAAGAVCTTGLRVPQFALAVGVPARIKEGAADQTTIEYSKATYLENAKKYPKEMRLIQ
jgi:carbonic anhydrase/acetyltransferase-like protein (isoleucine patch superfamily)